MDGSTSATTERQARTYAHSLSVIPHATLVAHPYRRLELGIGAGYVWLRPGHWLDFQSRARALSLSRKEPGRWRFNAELAVPVL